MDVRRILTGALATLALAGCGTTASETAEKPPQPAATEDPGAIHIHGLGRNPADGSLYIATHTGLFRSASEGEQPERVGDDYQDTMGFSVVGPDHFLGSGHPGSVRDAPPFLGLIESRDAGRSWKPVSLRGEVDFHVLESSGQTVYGFGSDFDSRELRFLRSDDRGRKWTALAPPEPLMSLAIDPADPLRVIGLGEGGAHLSRDGGRGWRRVDLPGGFVGWTAETGLTAIDLTGQVRTADDPTGPWRETGRVDGPPATVEAQGAELLVALHDGSIAASKDRGATWRELVPATTPR